MAEVTFKQLLEHPSYEQQKQRLNKDINWGDPKNQYIPDRKVFAKSKEEKAKLATLKMQHKKKLQKEFGADWKKHLNIPSESVGTIKLN